MNRFAAAHCLVLAGICFSGLVSAQDSWKNPMADPARSFYQVQQENQKHFKHLERELLREQREKSKMTSSTTAVRYGGMVGEEDEAEESAYLHYKRWEDYMAPRVYPSGDLSLPSGNWVNFEAYLNSNPAAMSAYQQSRGGSSMRVSNPNQSPQSSTWAFAGPTGAPTGAGAGRINCVRFDPTTTNTMYVGTPDGGLWKSTNGGTSWTTNTDQLTVIGVTDVAIDPTNTQNMYIATGDGDAGDSYSIGVLKSTNGGTTWNTTGLSWTVNQGRTISRLLINASNPQILIAASSAGIWRTTNGGTSWTQVATGGVSDMEYKPGDPNTVYAVGTSFRKSTDAGVTWTTITSGLPATASVDRLAIAVTAANAAYVYVLAASAGNDDFYGVYRSTDSGTTFTARSTQAGGTVNLLGWSSTGNDYGPGGQGWYDLAIDVSPTNQDVVIVGGVNVWRSTNGGTSWTLNAHWTGTGAPYIHADIHCLTFLPGNGTTYFSGNDGGIFKTTNSGGAWSDLSNNLCIAQIYRIGLSGSNASLWITGHQDNGTNLKNGATYAGTMGGDGMDCFIDRTNNNVMYGEQYSGSFNRSTNGGGSWTGITTGLSGTAPWVTPWVQDPTTANTLWCARSQVFKSTNQGTSWSQQGTITGSGTFADIKVAPSNNQVIYACRSNQLWKSTNGGGAWTNVTGSLPVASAALTFIAIKPTDPNTVCVTFSGYSSGNKVYKTTNGGTSWTNVSTGLPNLPANCIIFSPGTTTDAMYVGMDVGVYYIDNTFTSWQPYFTGLPNVSVRDLDVYQPTGKLRAATFGRGVWEVDIYNPGTLPPVAQFTSNTRIVCTGSSVNFTDQSSFSPTSWSWTFQGGTPGTSTAQNPTVTYNTAGTYSVSLTATNVNGNNTSTQTGYIIVLGSNNPPITEGFETATFLPTNWTPNNINNDGMFWTQASTGFSSTKSAVFDNYNNDVAGARDEMWMPRLNFGVLSTATLTFDVAYSQYDNTYTDTLEVLVSTNCGSTWSSVYLKGGTTLATAPNQTASIFTPTAAQWRNESVNLNTYAGQGSVLIIFRNRGHYGQALYVDNVNLTGNAAAAPPTAAFTASATTVCAGTAVNFTDASTGSPTSWSWTFPSGTPASATTQNVTGVTWSTAGTYTVTLTATNGSGNNSTTQVITVNALPNVSTSATSTTICSGNSTTITATGASTYAWMPGSLSGSPVTVSPTTTTTYTVTGTSAAGCVNTSTRTITVNPTPTVTTTASSTTICSGNSTTLTANGATTYTWMPGSLSGSPVTVSPTTTTTYTVTGTSTGCSGTSTRTITVNPSPTVTTTTSGGTICSGNSTTLTGNGASTYTWMPGSLSGSPVTVSPTTTTTYTVTGTAGNGCTGTNTRTITVNPSPTVTATATSTTICTGNSVTLTGNGASTYGWMPGSLSGTNVTVTPSGTTTYTVTGTAANGCTNTNTLTITVGAQPTVTASASSTTICNGNSTTLTGNGATTYTWMPGSLSGTSVTVSPASTTTYTVTGTVSAGCTNTATLTVTVNTNPTVSASSTGNTICAGNSTTLNATGASTYTWMPGSLSGSPVTVSPSATTTYTVTGTAANGCTATATQAITVNALPNVSASASTNTICAGASVNLTSTGASTYNWMPGSLSGSSVNDTPASSTTYTVTGTDANGCTNTANVSITVNALPSVSASASTNTICAGSSVNLTGNGASTYTWMPGNLSGSSVNDAPATSTTYTVTGTDANGCTNTANVSITVNTLPTVSATASNNTVCAGSSVTLTGNGANTYTWMPGNLTGSPVNDTPSASTTYTVTGTDANGCTNTGNVTITVNSLPSVSFTPTNDSLCLADGPMALSGSPAGGTFSGPGVTGSSFDASAAGVGVHSVQYSYTDVNGCSASAAQNITVDICLGTPGDPQPFVFTIEPNPNNGIFSVNLNVTTKDNYRLEVYDVLGQLVHRELLDNFSGAAVKTIDLTQYGAGHYSVRLISDKKEITKTVIVR